MNQPADFNAALERHFSPLRGLLEEHVSLQREILRQLVRKPAIFGVVTTQSGGYLINENKRGVVRCITNPTAADLRVLLYDGANGGNGAADFSAVLSPGESRHVFIVFHSGLISSGASGATVDGDLYS